MRKGTVSSLFMEQGAYESTLVASRSNSSRAELLSDSRVEVNGACGPWCGFRTPCVIIDVVEAI